MKNCLLLGLSLSALAVTPASAAPVPRDGAISGRIVAKKQGETAVLVPIRQTRAAEVRQDLKAGDVLRTNAAGTLAIVFADRTQIRVGRNSTLVVKEVRRGVPSSVSLQHGSLWARSPRGASQLSVETPSATAAIRGTEYSIVATDEQTTLTVVEGLIDFFNPQGRVEVRQGQSAAARLGQAPTRIFTVNPDAREQMLYYLSLDSALSYLRPSPLPQRAAREAVARVKGIEPANRTTEDWLAFAEAGAEVEPRLAVEGALKEARRAELTASQKARAQLVDASYAMTDRDYRRATQMFEEALPGLSGRQREVARIGVFVARTLLDPATANDEPPPLDENEPASYVGRAFLAGYLGDFEQARAIAHAGLKRFPEESSLFMMLAGIGLLTGDEKAIDEASRQALRVDPQDPFANRMQSELDLHYRGTPPAAIANAQRGVALAPGDDEMWNILARSLSTWDHGRRAEQAFKAGLAEEPNSFILHGNYALVLFQQQRIAEARRELAIARALDRDNALVHLTEGFLDLSEGRHDDALTHAMDATAANPAYSEGLLLLAEIYYANGDYDLALQQVEAADRADPNNPFVALYRAAFAIDSYRSDDAIAAAREALRRYRARGGVYASLSESKGTGSYIAGAFRLLNLDEWARYYGDRTYDPFIPASLFDRALTGVASPYLFRHAYTPFAAETGGTSSAISDVYQGLRLDPLAIAGSEKQLQLTRQKFVEASLAPSLIAQGDEVTLSQSAGVSAILLDPAPLAVNIAATRSRLELPLGTNNAQHSHGIQGFLGLKASPYDNILLNVGYSRQRIGLTGTLEAPRDNGQVIDRNAAVYGLFSHQFDRENVLTLGGGLVETKRTLRRADVLPISDDPLLELSTTYEDATRARGWLGFANYALGLGAFELQAGGELLSTEVHKEVTLALSAPGFETETQRGVQDLNLDQYRVYADLRFSKSDNFILQAQLALSGTRVQGVSDNHFDFSAGAAIEPGAGHWLRAAYVRASSVEMPFTLAPTAVVGLREAEGPLVPRAQSDTLIGRWEAEWSPHVFTSVEVQHQDIAGLSFERPQFVDQISLIDLFASDPPFGIRTTEVGPSRLDRASVSANVWLTGNVGVRAVYTFADSEVESGPGAGRAVPFAPRHFARGQMAWTSAQRVKVNAGVTYLGPRLIDTAGTRAERAWLGDIQLAWEPLDQQVEISAGLFNLFDEQVLLARGVPSFGRTFAASLELRF